jgi:DNA end-binding protein Ku
MLLLLKALIKSKKAGLARFVLRNTENLCIVHPVENVLVVTRIRFGQEDTQYRRSEYCRRCERK